MAACTDVIIANGSLLNHFFTQKIWGDLLKTGYSRLYDAIVKRYIFPNFASNGAPTNREILDKLEIFMSSYYRNEYFFRNRLLLHYYNEFSIKDYISPNGGAEYVCTHINGYTPWLYVMRRQTVRNCRFIQGVRVNEDVLFISQLLFTAATLCVCSYDGYFYRHRASSALGNGVTDDDMVLFLKGIVKTVVQVSLVMDEELFGRYQTWVARRALSDIKGCLLIKGVHPSRSMPLFKSLMSNKVINCANLLLKEKLLLILMKLGALGYRIVIGYYACRRKLSKLRKGHL